jgi:hypothetical protein
MKYWNGTEQQTGKTQYKGEINMRILLTGETHKQREGK